MELGELMQWTPHNINQTKTPHAPTIPTYNCEPHVHTKVFSNNMKWLIQSWLPSPNEHSPSAWVNILQNNHEFPLHKSTLCLGHSKLSSNPAPIPIWCYYTIMHDLLHHTIYHYYSCKGLAIFLYIIMTPLKFGLIGVMLHSRYVSLDSNEYRKCRNRCLLG